jgi:hypothetical protein
MDNNIKIGLREIHGGKKPQGPQDSKFLEFLNMLRGFSEPWRWFFIKVVPYKGRLSVNNI